jgi:hypothetical protein
MSKPKKSKSDGSIPTPQALGVAVVKPNDDGSYSLQTQRGPSAGVLAAVKASADQTAKLTKLKRLTLPPFVSAADVSQPGVSITGKVINVIPSPKSVFKGEVLWFQHASGQEFLFGANAVMLGALANQQGVKRDDVDVKKAVGHSYLITGAGTKTYTDGSKGSDGKPRKVNLFEIFCLE